MSKRAIPWHWRDELESADNSWAALLRDASPTLSQRVM